MSGVCDSYKPIISNMNSDSISTNYNTLDDPHQTPSAPAMDTETQPTPSSSAAGSSRLYPGLNPHQKPPSRQNSDDALTSNEYVYVRESNLPVTDNYASEVYRVGEISYSNEKVMGMVFVHPFLYVLHRDSNVLYKCNTVHTKSRAFISPPMLSQTISGLRYPRGMAANDRTKHLYITDRHLGKGRLVKASLDGVVVAAGDLPGLEPFGVSVGPSNEGIIVACCKNPCPMVSVQIMCAGFVVVFEDMGERLREQQRILLEESIQIPRHVLEAPKSGKSRGKEYLVVHGWVQLPGIECNHQISRVNSDGRIVRSFGVGHGKTERHLNRPMSICFDDCDKMFVVDSFNDRILLLNRIPCESYDLELVRQLLTKANGLKRPRHVCLDTGKRLLYVGKESGHIDVFYVGKESEDLSHSTQITK